MDKQKSQSEKRREERIDEARQVLLVSEPFLAVIDSVLSQSYSNHEQAPQVNPRQFNTAIIDQVIANAGINYLA